MGLAELFGAQCGLRTGFVWLVRPDRGRREKGNMSKGKLSRGKLSRGPEETWSHLLPQIYVGGTLKSRSSRRIFDRPSSLRLLHLLLGVLIRSVSPQ